MIPFGNLAPGLADTTPGRSAIIDGVIPLADGGYGPYPQQVTLSSADALPEAPRGHISFPKADGTYLRFVGTSDKWFQIGADGTTTEIASGFSLPSGDNWSFVVFGTKLLGSNTTDGVYAYDFEAGGSASAVSAAPAARELLVVGNVVVALDCDGDNRLIRNSAINDHTVWKGGGASKQPLAEGGALIGGVAVSQGAALVFQREGIRYMQFGGGVPLYTLTLLTDKAGAVSSRTMAPYGGGAFFIDTDGPKYFAPGMPKPQAIGADFGMDEWILDQVAAADLAKIEGAYDRFRRMTIWRIPVSGDSDTVFSRCVCFHVDRQKWSTLTVNTSALFTTALPGYTFDTMPDLPFDDSEDVPFDDRFWDGGEPLFGGFDENYKFFTFSGSPMAATLETSLHQFARSQYLNSVGVVTDATSATVQIGVAERIGNSLTWSGTTSLTDEGDAMFIERGRVFKGRLNIPASASWTYATGFDHINEGAR